jgi:hypothetical protein
MEDKVIDDIFIRRPNLIKKMIREVLQSRTRDLAEKLVDAMADMIIEDLHYHCEGFAEIIKEDAHGWIIRDNAATPKAKEARKQCKKRK